jgi:hypothetical protein
MDNKSLFDDLAGLISKEVGKESSSGAEQTGEQENILAESLKVFAGQLGAGVGKEVNEFLNGRGSLLETTRSAVVRSGSSASKEVAVFLKEAFNLPATMANTLAALLVKIFPSISKLTGEEEAVKPKRPRKKKASASASKPKKRKTASSAKPSSSAKPKKKKTSESKKPAAAAKPKKRKTSTTKKTAPSSKTKKRRSSSRSVEIPIGEE